MPPRCQCAAAAQVPLDAVDLSHVSILYTQGEMAAITPIYDYDFHVRARTARGLGLGLGLALMARCVQSDDAPSKALLGLRQVCPLGLAGRRL